MELASQFSGQQQDFIRLYEALSRTLSPSTITCFRHPSELDEVIDLMEVWDPLLECAVMWRRYGRQSKIRMTRMKMSVLWWVGFCKSSSMVRKYNTIVHYTLN